MSVPSQDIAAALEEIFSQYTFAEILSLPGLKSHLEDSLWFQVVQHIFPNLKKRALTKYIRPCYHRFRYDQKNIEELFQKLRDEKSRSNEDVDDPIQETNEHQAPEDTQDDICNFPAEIKSLASALESLFIESTLDEIKNLPTFRSLKQNSVWFQVSCYLFPANKDPRTLKRLARRYYNLFHRHDDQVCKVFQELRHDRRQLTDDLSPQATLSPEILASTLENCFSKSTFDEIENIFINNRDEVRATFEKLRNEKMSKENENSDHSDHNPEASHPSTSDVNLSAAKFQMSFESFNKDFSQRFLESTDDYPVDFPNHYHTVGKINLIPASFETLQPKQWLDDHIIFAFFLTLEEVGRRNGIAVLSFCPLFLYNLMNHCLSNDNLTWLQKKNPGEFELWLMPILIHGNHWVLVVLSLREPSMIFLDSLYDSPPRSLIEGVRVLIDLVSIKCQKRLNSKWKMIAPKEVPKQDALDGNCGVHVCLWGYIICSKSTAAFTKMDATKARKRIASYLLSFPKMIREKLKNNESSRNTGALKLKPIDGATITVQRAIPEEFKNVFEYCGNFCAWRDQ